MTEDTTSGFELLPEPPKHKHTKLLASIGAVIVLGVGGAVSYVAFAAGGDSGASSPQAAVKNVVSDLEQSDLIGVLDDLAPGERTALSGPIHDDIDALKRLGVLSDGADPSAVSGVHFAAHDLRYDDKTVSVNDHVQIVRITGGSVDLSAQASKLPFTQRFLDHTHAPSKAESQHVPITHPVRIAAVKVGDGWYASLFYTAADDAADHAIPTAADRIPAVGTESAEGAVQKLVHSLLTGDYRSAIALVSPAELGALHDYGGMLLHGAGQPHATSVTLKTLDLTSTPISDGGVRVGLKKLVLAKGRQEISVAVGGGCATVDAGPLHRKVCAADVPGLITTFAGAMACSAGGFGYGSGLSITPDGVDRGSSSSAPLPNDQPPACHGPRFSAAQKRAVAHLFAGLVGVGIDTAQVDGKWFVTPVRTFGDVGASVLSHLKGDDLFQLATLAN